MEYWDCNCFLEYEKFKNYFLIYNCLNCNKK